MMSTFRVGLGGKARILIAGFVLLFLFPVSAFAVEEVQEFQSDITVRQDSSIIVTERIRYNFEQPRHGIFRYIPLVYDTEDGEREIDIEVLEVQRDGSSEPYTTSEEDGNIRVRVGDPNETITGSHNYLISYEARWPINYFENYDEFYWDVTGHDWDVPIRDATARVMIARNFEPQDLGIVCYEGEFGSTEECSGQMVPSGTSTQLVFQSNGELFPGEGMTVAVRMPKGFVESPSGLERLIAWLSKNWPFAIPIVVFLFIFRRWFRRGRDPKKMSVYARYEPPEDMKPTLVGSIVDEKVHDRDLTAGLIYLAEQGSVEIRRIEDEGLIFDDVDYELTLEDSLESITGVEKDILRLFFGKDSIESGDSIRLSEVKEMTSFTDRVRDIKKKVHEEMADRDLFSKSPKKVRDKYLGIAFVVWGVTYLLMMFNLLFFNFYLSLAISGLIILGFSFIMTRKTKKGAEVRSHILGFKDFLSKTQKERLEFHNAPERSPEEFMEFLPYAIALGVEERWGEQFEDVYIESPSWYVGHHSGGRIAAPVLARGLSDFSQSTSKTANAASSSSSGGGFSGGGFGGGGGGSW